jgi:hypothetical protein
VSVADFTAWLERSGRSYARSLSVRKSELYSACPSRAECFKGILGSVCRVDPRGELGSSPYKRSIAGPVERLRNDRMRGPTLRHQLFPLCPIHLQPMQPTGLDTPDLRYACGTRGCAFCWQRDLGYFLWENGELRFPDNAPSLMKQALDRNHGYLYIESVAEGKRIWRCPVQDCPTSLVEGS